MRHVKCPFCKNEFGTFRKRPTCDHCLTRFGSDDYCLEPVIKLSDFLIGVTVTVAMIMVAGAICFYESTPPLFIILFGGIGLISTLALIGAVIEYTCTSIIHTRRFRQ